MSWLPPDAIASDTGNHSWAADAECSFVHHLPRGLQCQFVRNASDCQPDGGLMDYFQFTYCAMPGNLLPLSAVTLVLWLLYLFVFLGATAEDYFCPALKVMSNNLRLNQNLAGVTLLALGNGAPDMFGAYAAITQAKQGNAGLAIGAIFGAGIFVTTIVVGAVMFNFSFTLTQRPFMRDVIFYIIAVFSTFYVMWDSKIDWWEGAGFIGLYVVYVLVVLFGRVLYQKVIKKQLRKRHTTGDIPRPVMSPVGSELEENEEPVSPLFGDSAYQSFRSNEPQSPGLRTPASPTSVSFPVIMEDTEQSSDNDGPSYHDNLSNHDDQSAYDNQLVQSQQAATPLPTQQEGQGEGVVPEPLSFLHRPMRRTISGALEVGGTVGVSVIARAPPPEFDHTMRPPHMGGSETTPLLSLFKSSKKADRPVVKMLRALSPIDPNFKNERLWWKLLIVIKVPVTMLLAATIPLVDDGEEDRCWNKWLNVLHCVISPCFILLITEVGLHMIGGVFPVVLIGLLLGIVVAILVALTSSSANPPIYHFLFSWLGFAVAIVWIYVLANEIVNILQTLGVLVQLSNAVLGLTLLAWGNSIGDGISNYTMAKQGFPRMAISACFGGPLLNMLIGIGVASFIKALNSPGHSFTLRFGVTEFFCASFLLVSLVSSLVLMLVMGFKSGKIYGIWLVLFYLSFIVVAILAGTKVLTFKIGTVFTKS